MTENSANTSQLLSLTTQIVSAHMRRNTVAPADIPDLIRSIYAAISGAGTEAIEEQPKPTPAVPIKRSLHDDHIICLEDGKKLKTLKRHLKTAYNMTPEDYREKWGLSPDYPMVAPAYARQRSELAKQIGLGRGGTRR